MLSFLQREQTAIDAMIYNGWTLSGRVPVARDGTIIPASKTSQLMEEIRSPEEAVSIFRMLSNKYDLRIPYRMLDRGKNTGKIKAFPILKSDQKSVDLIRERMKFNGLEKLIEHECVLKTEEGKIVIMFSPNSREQDLDSIQETDTAGLNVIITDYSIYGQWTRTVVVWLPENKQ